MLSLLVLALGVSATHRLTERAKQRALQRHAEVIEHIRAHLANELLAREAAIRALAMRPELVEDAATLRDTPLADLQASPAHARVRALLGAELARRGDLGIFLIREDGISVASMYDENLGTPNFLLEERAEGIRRAWAGETVLLPPVRSDVALSPPAGPPRPVGYPTAFLATPVLADGRPIAILTIRYDAERFFASVSQASFGQTGEVLAFDGEGRLASASRYARALHERGVLEEGESEVAKLELVMPPGATGLDRAAEQAGVERRPYRNYRDAEVISAWVWDPELGVGFVAEQELAEVTADARRLVRVGGVLGLAAVLLLLASVLSLRHRPERSPLTALLVVMVLLVVGGGALLRLRELQRDALHDAERVAHLLVHQTHVAVELWLDGRLAEVSRLGRQPGVVEAAQALRDLPPEARLDSAPARRLLEHLEAGLSQRGDLGFELLDAQGRCLLAIEGLRLSPACELSQARGGSLERVLAGAELLIPGVRRAAPAGASTTGDTTLLVAAPIHAPSEPPIGALALRIDPRGQLSFLTSTARLGSGSETLLVGADGALLTESHFAEELVSMGLTEEGQGGVGLPLRTPSGEPTRAAAALQRGLSGSSVTPYLSTLGRPVVGAWLWDPRLGVGLVSETTQAWAFERARGTARLQGALDLLGVLALLVSGALLMSAARAAQRQELVELAEARRLAEQTNRGKDALLANVSHELRTPMNGVLGMIEVLLREDPEPALREKLTVMKESALALLRVLNDLLTFSKLRAGFVELEDGPFCLIHLVERSAALVRPLAEQAGDELVVQLGEGLPPHVRGDSLRLQQVLTNLLTNAVRFTRGGRVTLSVTRQAGDRLLFSVADTGEGIPEDKLDLIFEAFVQSDASTTRRFGGTGLGLPISANIVAAMGGELEVRSVVGQGSEFSFLVALPTVEAPPAPPRPASRSDRATPLRLLLAEDNPINQRVARAILESEGHEVTAVLDGSEAVREALSGSFDLVLMDLQMPHVDGAEAATCLRTTLSPEELPIVAVTAATLQKARALALGSGMQDVVTKPFTAETLLAAVRTWARTPGPLDLIGLQEEWRGLGAEHELPDLLRDFLKELETYAPTLTPQTEASALEQALRTLETAAEAVRAGPLHERLAEALAAARAEDPEPLEHALAALQAQVRAAREQIQAYLSKPASR
ncbi:MAG: response regulator [Alphaproteobacteria bacterium]|nr:response regulator [Alphaproteobacteria bacterium]